MPQKSNPHNSFLFANHDEVKPLELTVPLATTLGELKDHLRAQWPEGLPTQQDGDSDSSTVIAAVPTIPDPQQELQRRRRRQRPSSGPVEPQTPLSIASSSASPVAPAAQAGGKGESGAATDDEEEDEEEEGASMVIPPPITLAALRVPVDPDRIRLVCLGRGLDDDGKTLNQYHIPSFEYPTPVQCMIRPSAVRGGHESARRSAKSLEEGQEGEEDTVGPLGCCVCGVM